MKKEIRLRAARVLAQKSTRQDSPPWFVPWVMFQSWRKLLFMHWEVPFDLVRELVPSKMEVDTYEGAAYITMIPMHMVDIHLRCLPVLPGTGIFPEINFRTYVKMKGKPGIVFFSIDAQTPLGVLIADLLFKLPYVEAEMKWEAEEGAFSLSSSRPKSRRFAAASFEGTWTPTGTPHRAEEGSLEYFLVERYVMYAQSRWGILYKGHILHPPWEIQGVETHLGENTVPQALGLDLGAPDEMMFANRTDVMAWPMLPISL
jgi:uncharacterized protein YqjF (DUF2071 family)